MQLHSQGLADLVDSRVSNLADNNGESLARVARAILRSGEKSALIASARPQDGLGALVDELRHLLSKDDIEVIESNGYLHAAPLAPVANAPAFLVIQSGSCRRADLQAARKAIKKDGYQLLGTVLIDGTDPLPSFLRAWFPTS